LKKENWRDPEGDGRNNISRSSELEKKGDRGRFEKLVSIQADYENIERL